MELVLIAAVADNRVIGTTVDGKQKTPWHIPEDMKRFAQLTTGHPVIMGRATWDTLEAKYQPLPKRDNIVLTRSSSFRPNGIFIAHTLEVALQIAQECVPEDQRAYCIGGAQVYQELLPYATRLELTHVHQNPEGDTYFPELNLERDWKCTETNDRGTHTFATYVRPTAEKRL